MKINKSLFLTIFFSISLIKAQTAGVPKIKYTIAYFGETVTHLGLNLGFEYYPYQSNTHQIILASNIGGYKHIRNNTSIFIREQWGQRIHFKNGLFIDQFLGLGYLHQFTHGGSNYIVQPNGAVIKSPNTGQPKFMPSIAVGTGYSFQNKTHSSTSIFIRPELFWKAPFNGYYLTHFALNAGIIFQIGKKNEK